MYKIKCDDLTLYNPLKKDLVLGDLTLNLEVNKAGSLNFTLYPTHTYYNSIVKMRSVISVYRDDKVIFKGRVFSDKANFYKEKKVEVEGILTYFNDSIVRPYEYEGTIADYLAFLIDQHNSQVEEFQQFKLGGVTVTDSNDYIVRASSNTPTTWIEIEEKLIKLLGGYICIRYEEDGNYIDYIDSYYYRASQEIKYAVNLQDLENTVSGSTLATCIIPYGAKIENNTSSESEGEEITDQRVTIKSVNNGLDYIQNTKAVETYGKIYEVVTWDDVTLPANLLSKARDYLYTTINLNTTLTIKAVDLHLTDQTIESFNVGDSIRVYSVPHGINEYLILKSFSIKLASPSSCIFTIGKEGESFLDNQVSTERENSSNYKRIDTVEKNIGELESTIKRIDEDVQETVNYTNLLVENSQETTRTMLADYAKTSALEELNTTVSTTFSQTAEDFNFKFDTINERITTENGEINKELEEISKYIRFVDGNIILGEVGSPLTTKLANGRISFLYNDEVEVAYISEHKLYITNAEILTEIIIGDFGFVLRKKADGSFGNLSFKKVR